MTTVQQYDFFGSQFIEDPFPLYKRLREHDPVWWSEPFGAWMISRYADVRQLLTDERVTPDQKAWSGFSVLEKNAAAFPNVRWALDNTLLLTHDQRHRRLRTVALRPFGPQGCGRIAEVCAEVVQEVLDSYENRQEIELFTDFSAPVRIKVMSRLVGPRFTAAEEAYLVEGTNRALGFLEPSADLDVLARHDAALAEFRRFIGDVVDRGGESVDPDSILGQLMDATADGISETREDLIALVFSFLLAGTEATGSLITMGILLLLEHADQRAFLPEDASQYVPVIREILRYRSFTKFLPRYVVSDFELQGKTLRRGEIALLLFQSALRDPDAFEDPDTFDIRRQGDTEVFAFGRGIHSCVGRRFAEIEAAVALQKFFHRFPQATLRDNQACWAHHHMMVAVPPTLPVAPVVLR